MTCPRPELVICNGGSLTSQQALAAGVAVLGIASNMDQFLNMQAISEATAGAAVRADRLRMPAIRAMALQFLSGSAYTQGAAALGSAYDASDSPRSFTALHLSTQRPAEKPQRIEKLLEAHLPSPTGLNSEPPSIFFTTR